MYLSSCPIDRSVGARSGANQSFRTISSSLGMYPENFVHTSFLVQRLGRTYLASTFSSLLKRSTSPTPLPFLPSLILYSVLCSSPTKAISVFAPSCADHNLVVATSAELWMCSPGYEKPIGTEYFVSDQGRSSARTPYDLVFGNTVVTCSACIAPPCYLPFLSSILFKKLVLGLAPVKSPLFTYLKAFPCRAHQPI